MEKETKPIEDVIQKWRENARYGERGDRIEKCADELEALLPALEQRIIAMQDEGTELGMKLADAQAEIAELKARAKAGSNPL